MDIKLADRAVRSEPGVTCSMPAKKDYRSGSIPKIQVAKSDTVGKPGGEGQSVFPICPDPPFPRVPTADAVRKTKGKMMSSIQRQTDT